METERLRLTPLREADADWLHTLWTGPAVRRYLWDDEIIPAERTRAIIAESIRERDRYGLWSAAARTDGRQIGFCGYWPFFDPPVIQLICGLDPGSWGLGYAHEMCVPMIRHGHETLGMDTIRAATDAPNTASIRALERLGFRHEKTETVNGLETLFYTHRA